MDDLTHSQPKMTWFKAVLFLGMLLFAFYGSTHMVAAGDTWVALACGRHFANHGVDTVEPFSFNSHPAGPSDETLKKFPEWSHGLIRTWHPTGWLNQNWLTHLGFYKLATWFGHGDPNDYNALVYWKFAIYFITVFAVYGIGKTLGAGDTLSAAAACLAMLVGRTFYDIRPAGYSNMLVPVFILILAVTMCKNYRLIWLVVPLVVFWANVHGGYIYAFIMFIPFVGINLLCRVPRRWTLCVGLSGLWLVLYLMSHKFITHEYYIMAQKAMRHEVKDVSLLANSLFATCVVLIAGSVVLSLIKKIPAGLFYAYHYLVSFVLFVSLIVRFMPKHPENLNNFFDTLYTYYVSSSTTSFIFVFIAGVLLISAMAFKKDVFVTLPTKGLSHVIGAGASALVAMVIFNPFHLTNITHTFEISVSKHAESWRQVNEWKPAFDWMDKTTPVANPVGEEEWFAVLCVLTGIALLVWLVSYFMKPSDDRLNGNRKAPPPGAETEPSFVWPKINLPIIIVALLTIYMAIRSRRFIALAGSAAAPIVALFIWQAWQMISARVRFKLTGAMKTWTIPTATQYTIKGVITLVLIGLTVYWGGKYKRIYVDPWPSDHAYNSVFMRMTASHLKPTDACRFLRDNQISGKVFNYWTEGGAVAFGQTPDPETGFIPLKLFMDGRAQAAYDHETFKRWQLIFAGGPIAQESKRKKEKMTPQKQEAIGTWIDRQLGEEVWIVLMPQSQDNSIFVRSLVRTGHWKTAYIDDYQHMLVNVKTAQGEMLISQILADQAEFPNVHAKGMTMFSVILENGAKERYKDLYGLASEALQDFPTPSSMIVMTRLKSFPAFKPQLTKDLQAYVEDFLAKRDSYKKEDGYYQRLVSARMAINFLMKETGEGKAKYSTLSNEIGKETKAFKESSVW